MADETTTITGETEAATPLFGAAENTSLRDDEREIYEVGYHLMPTISEEEVVKEAAAIRALIEKEGGTFISEDTPKPMMLAYEIALSEGGKRHKYSSSYFGWIKFDVPREAAGAVKAALSAHDSLIRFCFVKTVREDTRAPKHIAVEEKQERTPRTPLEPLAIERRTPLKEETKPKTTLTDEEIDRTIEELIAE